MNTGFDMLEHNRAVRKHWLKRFAACLIDVLLIFLPLYLALYYAQVPYKTIVTGVGAGVIWFFYSSLTEWWFGRTLGKTVVRLKVVSLGERRRLRQIMIRSVPKFFWYIFLPFDVAVGLATEGDPRRRWSDGVAHTLVIAYYPDKLKKRSHVPAPNPRMGAKLREQEINSIDEI